MLNLPDADELFEEIFVENDRDKEFDRNSLGQVNPTVARSITLSTLNAETARLDAARTLSKESQQQMASEIQQLEALVNSAAEMGQGSGNLSQQASQAAQQSDQLSQQAAQIAEESKTRVSTQDAIKDLNQIAGNLSGQLTQLSGQGAAQSGQLSNISGQLGSAVNLEGRQLLRMNQVVTGMAVANQNIADMNETMQGDRRIRVAENNAQLYRSLQISRLGYRMNLGSNRFRSSQPNSNQ